MNLARAKAHSSLRGECINRRGVLPLPKKLTHILVASIVTTWLVNKTVYAERGCCSWNGGVSHCDSSVGMVVCNNGFYSPSCVCYKSPAIQPTSPICPSNSSYSSSDNTCPCNLGYAPSLNKQSCVFIPTNAHAVSSSTDVWLCDSGYEEINNSCQPIFETISSTPTNAPTKNTPTSITVPQSSNNNTAITLATLATVSGGVWYWNRRKNK